jgi:hypothetical protein
LKIGDDIKKEAFQDEDEDCFMLQNNETLDYESHTLGC